MNKELETLQKENLLQGFLFVRELSRSCGKIKIQNRGKAGDVQCRFFKMCYTV